MADLDCFFCDRKGNWHLRYLGKPVHVCSRCLFKTADPSTIPWASEQLHWSYARQAERYKEAAARKKNQG